MNLPTLIFILIIVAVVLLLIYGGYKLFSDTEDSQGVIDARIRERDWHQQQGHIQRQNLFDFKFGRPGTWYDEDGNKQD
jgi:hypothetical protein